MIGFPRTVRRTLGTVVGTLAVAAASAPATVWSQSQSPFLPPVVRACVADADTAQRLDCYDREVARLLMPPDRSSVQPASVPTLPPALRACVADADATRREDCYDREVARLIMPPARPAADQVAATPAVGALPPPASVAPKSVAMPSPAHFTAHVARVEADADQIVVHLDNGQAWEQTVSGSTDLSLHSGDTVKIDRQLGSWWLTDRFGGTVQVRLGK